MLFNYLSSYSFKMTDSSEDEYEDAETELPSSLERRLDRVEKAQKQLQEQMKMIINNLEDISITLESHPSPVTKEQTKRVRSCPARKTPAFAQPSSSKEAEPVEAAYAVHDDTEELVAVLKDFPTLPASDLKSRGGKPATQNRRRMTLWAS